MTTIFLMKDESFVGNSSLIGVFDSSLMQISFTDELSSTRQKTFCLDSTTLTCHE
jgi:hypothetical protein